MGCQLFLKCLNSCLQSAMMKFLNLVALVSSVYTEARYDTQMTSSLPIASYNPSATYESSSPTPYNFSYEVKTGEYPNFGDVRVGDRQGKVSGSYHVQLPDGRHQHVIYKDEGKGYIVDVKYDGELKHSESKPTDYKQLANISYGPSDSGPALNGLPYEESYKSPPYTNVVNENQLNDSENKKCKSSKTCNEEPSYLNSNKRIYTEPVRDLLSAVSYQEPSSTTPFYKEHAYTSHSNPTANTTQVPYTTRAYDVPISTSTVSPWRPITVTSTYANNVYTTEEYKTTSTSTTSETPLTTPDYTKTIYSVKGHKKTVTPTVAYKQTIYTTPAYKIRSTSKVPKAPKAPKASKSSYPVTTPAYKKPVYSVRPFKIPVAITPAPNSYWTTTYAPKTNPYTPRAYKAASYQISPQKQFAVYIPPSHRVPVITRVAPYSAPAYNSPFYIAPVYNIPPYKVAAYTPANYANVKY